MRFTLGEYAQIVSLLAKGNETYFMTISIQAPSQVSALQGVAEITADRAESNGSLPPGLWRDSFHFTCALTACTPGSAPGPTLGNEYGKTLPF